MDVGVSEVAVDAPATPELTFPTDDASWPSADPSSSGWDAAKLDAALEFAGSRASKAVVILLRGKILAERYWTVDASFARDIASAQKSMLSLLTGIAVDKKLLALDETVTSILGAGWSNADAASEAKIQVVHLLSMTSGLDTKLGAPVPPGSAWLYNTDAYHRVQMVLEKKAGLTIEELSHQWLFDPIGAKSSHWQTRATTDSKGLPYWGLQMTARDMARVGLLVEAGGAWREASVVPSAWIETATHPSQTLNPSYGYLWWLNGQSFALLPGPGARSDGPIIPDAPADVVAALGAMDQKIYVAKTDGLVVTRLGGQAGTKSADALSDFDTLFWAKIMAARK
jgi:CubicO group peptidase (beta-lactamase class C family)